MKRVFTASFYSIFFVSMACGALAADTNAPAAATLVNAGKATAENLLWTPASWSVKCSMGGQAVMWIDAVRDKNRRSWDFFQLEGGRPEKICRVIQADGAWHVLEVGHSVKALPYQAELHFPAAYLFLSLAEPCCVLDASLINAATFQGREDSKVSYRAPLPAANRRMLEKVVSEYEKFGTNGSNSPEKSVVTRKLKQIRDLLANGSPLSIDEKTGIVTETTVQQIAIEVSDFRWLSAVPPGAFELPKNTEWEDQTKTWPESDFENCILVGHDPLFAAGAKSQLSPDGYILNLRTEEMRRLPYHGVVSSGGCFLKGRHEVIVSGVDAFEGTQLLKINLVSGENKILESTGTGGGMDMNAELSPDGKQFATMRFFGGDSMLDFQMRLIDLETGKSKNIGKPGHLGSPFSWLPDGNGLILKRFEHMDDVNAVEPRIVCRMGLDGRLTDLRRGDTPIVLRESRKILYEDTDTGLWHTCNLDGSTPELFGDGFKGCDMPTVSPDEKRIIFAYYEKGKLPRLMLFDMGNSKGKPVGHAAGFTAMPVWRYERKAGGTRAAPI